MEEERKKESTTEFIHQQSLMFITEINKVQIKSHLDSIVDSQHDLWPQLFQDESNQLCRVERRRLTSPGDGIETLPGILLKLRTQAVGACCSSCESRCRVQDYLIVYRNGIKALSSRLLKLRTLLRILLKLCTLSVEAVGTGCSCDGGCRVKSYLIGQRYRIKALSKLRALINILLELSALASKGISYVCACSSSKGRSRVERYLIIQGHRVKVLSK